MTMLVNDNYNDKRHDTILVCIINVKCVYMIFKGAMTYFHYKFNIQHLIQCSQKLFVLHKLFIHLQHFNMNILIIRSVLSMKQNLWCAHIITKFAWYKAIFSISFVQLQAISVI